MPTTSASDRTAPTRFAKLTAPPDCCGPAPRLAASCAGSIFAMSASLPVAAPAGDPDHLAASTGDRCDFPSHLVCRIDPKNTKTGRNDNGNGSRKGDFGPGRVGVALLDEPQFGHVVPPVPQTVEHPGQIIQIEGHAM